MDKELGRQSRPQCSNCCHSEQAGQDQLGSVIERRKLSPEACLCTRQLDEVTLKFASQKSAEEEEGRKHSQMACPRTCVEIRVFHDRRDNKDGHTRIIIMRPERILHQRPDPFSQTASRPTQFFLHSGGGPYIFQQQRTGETDNRNGCTIVPFSNPKGIAAK